MGDRGRSFGVTSQTHGWKIAALLIGLSVVVLGAGYVFHGEFVRGAGLGMLLVGVAYLSIIVLRRRSIH